MRRSAVLSLALVVALPAWGAAQVVTARGSSAPSSAYPRLGLRPASARLEAEACTELVTGKTPRWDAPSVSASTGRFSIA